MKKYTLKIYETSGKIETVRTKKRKRFFKFLRTINWQSGIKKSYIKVSYGKKVCIDGCLCEFWNDGYYNTKEELLEIIKYFDNED